jgi:hypothetical protein
MLIEKGKAMVPRIRLATEDNKPTTQQVARRLTQLGLQPHQIERHTKQLKRAMQPKPKQERDPRWQPFDGWCSGVCR